MDNRFVRYVLAALLVVSGTDALQKVGDSIVYDNVVNLTSIYELQWTVQTDTVYFQLTLSPAARTWLAIGFHPVGSPDVGMTNADIYISLFDDATGDLINVTDAWSVAEGPPAFDQNVATCTDDVVPGSFSGSQDLTTNITVAKFARKLVTADVNCDQPIEPGSLVLIFAHGTSNTFGYHGYGNAGFTNVTLTTGKEYANPRSKRSIDLR